MLDDTLAVGTQCLTFRSAKQKRKVGTTCLGDFFCSTDTSKNRNKGSKIAETICGATLRTCGYGLFAANACVTTSEAVCQLSTATATIYGA